MLLLSRRGDEMTPRMPQNHGLVKPFQNGVTHLPLDHLVVISNDQQGRDSNPRPLEPTVVLARTRLERRHHDGEAELEPDLVQDLSLGLH